ncbi:unnamed protein product [Trypanosoma congolense IL3000]|uniref:WGS project CAEQ00000000 data, annotated contig 1437 n=1 Tax=Trypanosoma congolense (strain IL3000) TaxID=1068625 RepID=F9W692_TRYCI|nr:unnamed protein product [Trypanosoma congolense IL3000]
MRRTSLLLCSLLIALCSLCALSEQPPAAESQVELTQFDLSRSGGRSVGRKKTKEEKHPKESKVKVEDKKKEEEAEEEEEEAGEEEQEEEEEGHEDGQDEEEGEEEEEEGEEQEVEGDGNGDDDEEADGNTEGSDSDDAADADEDVEDTATVEEEKGNDPKGGKKLDENGAKALCTMKMILKGAEHTIVFLDKQIASYTDVLKTATRVPKGKPRKDVTVDKVIKEVGIDRKINDTLKALSTSLELLRKILRWYCVGSKKQQGGKGVVPNANCEKSAYKRDYYHRRHKHDPLEFSILCNYKKIPHSDVEATPEAMEAALKRWNESKPQSIEKKTDICRMGPSGVVGSSGGKTCVVSEDWLPGYEKTMETIKKLEDLHEKVVTATETAVKVLSDKEHEEANEALNKEDEARKASVQKKVEEALKQLKSAEAEAEAARAAFKESRKRASEPPAEQQVAANVTDAPPPPPPPPPPPTPPPSPPEEEASDPPEDMKEESNKAEDNTQKEAPKKSKSGEKNSGSKKSGTVETVGKTFVLAPLTMVLFSD